MWKNTIRPKTRRNKVFLLLGIVLSLWGIKIILQPKYYNPIYRRELDFTGYNAPFGIFLIIIGIFFILTTLRNKTEAGKADAALLICPKCETTVKKEDAATPNCPRCMSTLENLSGFYDRHPELRGEHGDKGGIS